MRSEGFRGPIETDVAGRIVYSTDNSVYQVRPACVVVPENTHDLAALARANHRLDEPFGLVARGGGTGTNGQSLTDGIVVDTRRSMHRIVSIDADARTAVVEPGVVLAQLNAALATHGLMFAPHVSTATRATIGGMVATDASGMGSLVHGRTNRHVVAISAVLADGERWTCAPLGAADVDDVLRRDDRLASIHRAVRQAADGIAGDAFPDVPRGFTGYNLADVAVDRTLDLTKLLCGSEGTLALIGEITVRLTPLPTDPHLAVVVYATFDAALCDANRLKAAKPISIECLDERTVALAATSPAYPRLAALLGRPGKRLDGALLMMGFAGVAGVERLRDLLVDDAGVTASAITSDRADMDAAWKVRADAVGLLAQAVHGRRSVAFVEDCAVPPHRLEDFVREFRQLLDGHDISYGMFGHADVGCVHVRPALDLYDPHHERLLRVISDQVAALVTRLGGVLWGEHGRGFRGEFVDLDDDTLRRMREIKTAFDPRNVLNPGKLYAPFDGAPIKRIDAVPLRVHRDRTVASEQRAKFESAFACNGNGICHHWGDGEVMCPSYKVTLDPRLSPKGRADLLRAWLAEPDDATLVAELSESMRKCLSCGACSGRCPVEVDIPEMKSRVLEAHPARGRERIRNAVVSRFESVLPMAQRWSRVVGPAQRTFAPLLARGLGLVDLPVVPPVVAKADGEHVGEATVVVVPDAFSAYLDPSVLASAFAAIRAIGERPALAPFVPSGKFDHVTGNRTRFAVAARRRRELFERLAVHGVPLVVIEPAVALLSRHEYSAIDSTFPQGLTTSLAEYLEPRVDRLRDVAPDGPAGRVQLFGHCTEVSLAPDGTRAYRAMLEAVGYEVQIESTTCCGMAGIFGHEAEHRDMSTRLFEQGWRPKLEAGTFDHRCASGYSCRSQAARLGDAELLHPVEVVARRIAPTG